MSNNRSSRSAVTILTATLLAAGCVFAGQPIHLDSIAPSLSQLGAGWTSNQVVVFVDQRTPTNEIGHEHNAWLKAARSVVGKRGREAYLLVRYTYGSNDALVWIIRCKDAQSVGVDWGRDKETKTSLENLPKVGEEVRFYQRHGRHNNIAFRRNNYLVDIESVSVPVERLRQLAELLDANLVRVQQGPTTER